MRNYPTAIRLWRDPTAIIKLMEGQSKGYEIFGRGLTPERKEEASVKLDELRKEGLKPVEGELEKKPEELALISKINIWIEEEYEKLKIPKVPPPILPEQVHFLPSEAFAKIAEQKRTNPKNLGFREGESFSVYINASNPRYAVFEATLHESLHLAVRVAFYVDVEKEKFLYFRSGLGILKQPREEGEPGQIYFVGLSEAITEHTEQAILLKHQDEAIKELGFTKEEIEESKPAYRRERKVLETIIRKVAEEKNEEIETVWRKFERGNFTGELLPIARDIDETFGKGSLRVLAALTSPASPLPSERQKQINVDVLRYFETEDEKERGEIAREVLEGEELQKYARRRGEILTPS